MKPKAIKLPFKLKKPILSLGSQIKNTVCFAVGNTAYLSPLYRDLSNPLDFTDFRKTVDYFLRKKPKIIACDLHPEYQSTKYAYQLSAAPACLAGRGYLLSAIQHHHAHIASCMVENGLTNQKVIGVAFDGTGLGSDNRIWGAEFLICDYRDFKRVAHLREIPLLGQERAIAEPLRLAFAWLYPVYKDKLLSLSLFKGMHKDKYRVLKKMYSSGFNSPSTSSMGRLFDAVATLILNKGRVDFEAELAIKLEELARKSQPADKRYVFRINKDKNGFVLDPALVFKGIISDLKRDRPREEMAYKFHYTVASMVEKVCALLRRKNRINRVVLSGGVFQNKLLLRLALDLLYKDDFAVFMHGGLSPGDSSLSLGQVAVANFQS